MNGRGIRLGSIAGIEVSADLGVLVIGGLLTWSFSTGVLPAAAPGLESLTYWLVGLVGAAAFLMSLLGHELSHSLVARRNGLRIDGITLWLFGGVARFEGEPTGPGAEFRIAAAGPLASAVIGAASWGLAYGLGRIDGPEVWVVMLGWLGLINLVLAVFNLLPGSPLDGGRILGSVLWKLKGDRAWGRWGAARVGQVIAVLLVAAGFAEMWFTRSLGGLWTVLIGWFLFNAARVEATVYRAEQAVSGLTVAGAMLTPAQVTSTWSTIDRVVEGPFAHTSQMAVPVVDGSGQVRGLLLMDAVKALPADRWSTTQAVDVMLPMADGVVILDPDEPMTEAVRRMGTWSYGLVLSGRELVGILGPSEIRRAVDLGFARSRKGLPAGPPPPPLRFPNQQWQAPPGHR
jgi:Zn-dependent protease/CBS domain-containing protein